MTKVKTKVKSTEGIEKNMHEEIGNLVHKAYHEGFEDGAKAADTLGNCSWEQGVKDAWGCVTSLIRCFADDDETSEENGAAAYAIAGALEETDPLEYTRAYNEARADEPMEDEIKVGDLVIDPNGKECVITNMETHIHVIYPESGKTHKWSRDTKFKPTGEHIVGVGKVEL